MALTKQDVEGGGDGKYLHPPGVREGGKRGEKGGEDCFLRPPLSADPRYDAALCDAHKGLTFKPDHLADLLWKDLTKHAYHTGPQKGSYYERVSQMG